MVPSVGQSRVDNEEEALMTAEENNKALVRRFFEAQERGDLDAIKEMMAANFVDHSLRPGQDSGREGYLRATAEDLDVCCQVQAHNSLIRP
jgi:ketosteroid isomerase-like protein